MITPDNLKSIRTKAINKLMMRDEIQGNRITVGMATCGIAAGAGPVMNALANELKKRNIKNVDVAITGCIGICRMEPVVEVYERNGSRITYVKMTPEKAVRVINEHIVNGRICLDLTMDEKAV